MSADLEARIRNRKTELSTKLAEHNASSQIEAAVAGDKIKARLSELNHLVKEGVVDGWVNIGEGARTKLEQWLAK